MATEGQLLRGLPEQVPVVSTDTALAMLDRLIAFTATMPDNSQASAPAIVPDAEHSAAQKDEGSIVATAEKEGTVPAEVPFPNSLTDLCLTINWTPDILPSDDVVIRYYHSNPAVVLPRLLFIHGLTDAAGCCLLALSGLADSFHVFVADNRGHGLTQPCPPDSFTMENLVNDSFALMERMYAGQPLFVIGHSMGATVAAHLAGKHPSMVQALVLEDPPWRTLPGQAERSEPPLIPPCPREGGPFAWSRKVQEFSKEEFAEREKNEGAAMLPPWVHTRLWASRMLDVDSVEKSFMEGTGAVISEAVMDLTVPVLLQSASHIDPGVAKKALESYTDAKDTKYPGEALHVIHELPTLMEWLKEVRGFFKSFLIS